MGFMMEENTNSKLIIRHFNELRNDIRAGQEELRKHMRGVRTDVKTVRCAVRNDVKDRLERSISAVSVGQEELENRFLNQDRGQTGR
jgi:hypothetical protein